MVFYKVAESEFALKMMMSQSERKTLQLDKNPRTNKRGAYAILIPIYI